MMSQRLLVAAFAVAVLASPVWAQAPAPSPEELAGIKAEMKAMLEEQARLNERLRSVEAELAEYKGAAGRDAAKGLRRTEPIAMVPRSEPISDDMGDPAHTSLGDFERDRWERRWYLSLCGGFADRNRSLEEPVTYIDWEDGWTVHGAFGYRVNENLRLEVESGAFSHDVDRLSANDGFGGALLAPGSGDATVVTLMMNLILEYPIHFTDSFTLTPYVGGGFGGAKSFLDGATNEIVEPFGFVFTGNSKVDLAVQLLAGVSYPISEHLEVYGGYRYVNMDKMHFVIDLPNGMRTLVGPNDTEVQEGEFGIRFTF